VVLTPVILARQESKIRKSQNRRLAVHTGLGMKLDPISKIISAKKENGFSDRALA
jgi:hypothetical protein